MIKRLSNKKMYLFLIPIIIILLAVIIFITQYSPSRTPTTALYESGHYTNGDILILYTNDEKSAVTLRTNMDSPTPIVYFDTIYEKIVYHDDYYYLTDDTHFLRINPDGTFEDATLSSYEDVEENLPFPVERDENMEYGYNFSYTQSDGSEIFISYTLFELDDYNITHMVQINDYFK